MGKDGAVGEWSDITHVIQIIKLNVL